MSFARKKTNLKTYQEKMGYAFIAIPLILFFIFMVLPAISAIYFSFTNYDIVSRNEWVGLYNYKKLINDELFFLTLKNIFYYIIMAVPLTVICSLGLAILLNKKIKGITIFRTIYYAPVITSSIAASTIWLWLLNPVYGLVNQVLGYFGIPGPTWLSNSSTAMVSVVIVVLWQNVGINMIIYLAGLQGVPDELYEAARVDGANSLRCFRYITLPSLKPTTFFVLTMTMIQAFQLFDQAYVLTSGGPGNSTLTPVFLIYNNGFGNLRMGYASAQAFVLFIIIFAFSYLNMRVNRESVNI